MSLQLLEAAHMPRFAAPSSLFKASNAVSPWPCLSPFPLTPARKVSPCTGIHGSDGAHLRHPGPSAHLRVSILVTSAKGLLPCKVTYSQIPGITAGTSLGVCYPAYCALRPHFHYGWREIPSESQKSESLCQSVFKT